MPEIQDRNDVRWSRPCPPGNATVMLGKLIVALCPDMPESSHRLLVSLVQERGYSEGELTLAVQEAHYDETTADNVRFAKRITPADIDRLVRTVRIDKQLVGSWITEEQRVNLLLRYPSLKPEGFYKASYDHHHNPLYKYSAKVAERKCQT